MRFALLGDHPDGLDMARALVASGHHELAAYTGQPAATEALQRWGLTAQVTRDLEEILADPDIGAIIVASRLADRPAHLRRALQSEHHVLCVHPVDDTPDSAYEAALIQGDTQRVLLPLLPEALHPAFRRLAEFIRAKEGPLGGLQLFDMERSAADAIMIESSGSGQKPSLRGWDVLRILGGEVAEVFAFGAGEELAFGQPLLLAGQFDNGGLFHETLLPGDEAPWHLTVIGSNGRAELQFPQGWPGPACLSWHDSSGATQEERWETWNPWPTLVDIFDQAVARTVDGTPFPDRQSLPFPLTWQTEVRCLELDDAARRSIERRRISTLEYPEATEEVGFKGTMTLVGCGLLWVILLLVIMSAWVPSLRYWWVIVPLLIIFLGMQMLRRVVPRSRQQERRRHGDGI